MPGPLSTMHCKTFPDRGDPPCGRLSFLSGQGRWSPSDVGNHRSCKDRLERDRPHGFNRPSRERIARQPGEYLLRQLSCQEPRIRCSTGHNRACRLRIFSAALQPMFDMQLRERRDRIELTGIACAHAGLLNVCGGTSGVQDWGSIAPVVGDCRRYRRRFVGRS